MTLRRRNQLSYAGLLAFGLISPFLFPNYMFQLAVLWIMVMFAQTWDVLGGQMGYNSLGNIFFFGTGMYMCAIVQIAIGGHWQGYEVAQYTSHTGVRLEEFTLAAGAFVFLRWLYSTRFGLAVNAIRDDEEKAESMGIHTKRYKTVAFASAAFFLGISGGLFGNMVGFIEPLEVAFPTVTFGIFMVVMALLGGKGTFWGPVLGAALFHVIKEATWIYMLGWQWVALGTPAEIQNDQRVVGAYLGGHYSGDED